MAEPERFIHADSGHRERAEIGEHTIVQACILAYVQTIGWTFMSRAEAEQRRGFDPEVPAAERAKNRSLFVDDLFYTKLEELHPSYFDAEGVLLGQFRRIE